MQDIQNHLQQLKGVVDEALETLNHIAALDSNLLAGFDTAEIKADFARAYGPQLEVIYGNLDPALHELCSAAIVAEKNNELHAAIHRGMIRPATTPDSE